MRSPISPERWTRIESLFTMAAEMRPEERGGFLEAQCGADAELRDEIVSLLRHDTLDPGVMTAVQSAAADLIGEDSLAGSTLGPWRVEREIGRGGMSVVYLATRADGQYEKRTAIKLIKRGMDTAAVIERLRRERRILASLDHPFIARMLDGGTTPGGLPYIVMDYVEGVPIDRWCEEQNAGVEERCDLMARVCEAVAYAHRSLVIHRDLKPGNILVARDGSPRLLDFGIARVLNDDTEKGAAPETRAPFRALTREYASPEQLAGDVVGTATDVYSLGVVLFELLTGERPGSESLRASTVALRAGKPRRWAKPLQGDLDTILQVSLRTEPARRYAGAEQLGEDLRLHLKGMPVTAREETLLYRCNKFVGRHRLGVAAASVLVALGGAGTGLYVHQARLAASRFEELHQFANSFLFGVDDKLRDTPNSTAARAMVAQNALAYLNGLALEKGGDKQLRREAGNAWRRLGDLQGDPNLSSLGDPASARTSYQRSIALLEPIAKSETGKHTADDARSSLLESYGRLALLERIAGNSAVAESLYPKAIAIARQVNNPPDPERQATLGALLSEYGETLDIRGKVPQATQEGREAVDLLEAAAKADPRYLSALGDALSNLGAAERNAQDWADGLEHHTRNLEIRQRLVAGNPESRGARRDLVLAWSHIGDLYSTQGSFMDPAKSLSNYEQMLAVARTLAGSDPTDQTARVDVAICLQRVGAANAASGRPEPAIAAYQESVAMLDQMRKPDRYSRQTDEYLAVSSVGMGEQYLKLSRLSEGRANLKKSIELSAEIMSRDPGTYTAALSGLTAMEDLADSLAETGERPAAIALTGKIESAAREVDAHATTQLRHSRLPEAFEKIGVVYEKLHEPATARVWYQRSLDAWAAMAPLSKEFTERPGQVKARLAALTATTPR